MLNKKIRKIIAIGALTTIITTGIGGTGITSMVNVFNGNPTETYALSSTFNPNKYGTLTDMGWVTSKVKCVDNLPASGATIAQLKAMSIQINPVDNPSFFAVSNTDASRKVIASGAMNLTNEIYYWSRYDEKFGMQKDTFYKVLSMKKGSTDHSVYKEFTEYDFVDGVGEKSPLQVSEYIDFMQSNLLDKELTPTPTPTPDPKPEPIPDPKPTVKTYTSTRLGGIDRYSTASSIANQYNSGKVNSVVLTSGFNFPDALTGCTLASQKNAPILLVGSAEQNGETMNYIKNHLNAGGTIYILGGTGAVSDSVISQIKSYGFNNFQRLGGIDRFATNLSIINAMSIPNGTEIVVTTSEEFADSLSISGIAGSKGMPIFLIDETFSVSALAKIKSIAPNKIYIVGGTSAVSSRVENQLKSIGSTVRLGGINRYETSLSIAKYFTTTSITTAMFATGHNFPDALAGSSIASKYGAPILLVDDNVTAQKTFINGNKIKDLFILGDKGVISDSLVNILKK